MTSNSLFYKTIKFTAMKQATNAFNWINLVSLVVFIAILLINVL